MRFLLAALMVLITIPAHAQQKITRKTKLTETSFERIRKALQEKPTVEHWQKIPWRPDLNVAIEEARGDDKPILLWMMNGHPCGMT